jgi:LysM repeat protein
MPDVVLTIREMLPRLGKPILLLLVAVSVVIGAVYLFDFTAERARAAASPNQAQTAAPTAPAAAAPTPAAPMSAAPAPAAQAPATPPRAATPRTSAVPAQPTANHHVVAGETLAAIAVRYDVPAEQLATDNALTNPNQIRAGQQLRISPKAANAHVIKPGETLSALANQHGLSLAQLRALNPQISNPDLILAGQQLQLR